MNNIIEWFKAGTRVRAAVGLTVAVFVLLAGSVTGMVVFITSMMAIHDELGTYAAIVYVLALVAVVIGVMAYFDEDSPL